MKLPKTAAEDVALVEAKVYKETHGGYIKVDDNDAACVAARRQLDGLCQAYAPENTREWCKSAAKARKANSCLVEKEENHCMMVWDSCQPLRMTDNMRPVFQEACCTAALQTEDAAKETLQLLKKQQAEKKERKLAEQRRVAAEKAKKKEEERQLAEQRERVERIRKEERHKAALKRKAQKEAAKAAKEAERRRQVEEEAAKAAERRRL